MAEDEPKTIGGDGIFKLLAWKTVALPKQLGVPETVGPAGEAMKGAAKRSAIEKFLAVRATMPDRKVGKIDLGEMWIDEVKDSPMAKQTIEIAGKRRIEEAAAEGRIEGRILGIAHGIVRASCSQTQPACGARRDGRHSSCLRRRGEIGRDARRRRKYERLQ